MAKDKGKTYSQFDFEVGAEEDSDIIAVELTSESEDVQLENNKGNAKKEE